MKHRHVAAVYKAEGGWQAECECEWLGPVRTNPFAASRDARRHEDPTIDWPVRA